MLSVVNGYNSGLGGGGLAVVRRASGEILTIDGRETAPTRAVPEMFFREGAADPSRSQIGPLAVGVPGLLQLLSKLSREEGKIDWHDGLVGAAIVAEQGFYVTPEYASVLALKASELKRFPASAQVLLNASGEAWPVGHRLQQSDLARTL